MINLVHPYTKNRIVSIQDLWDAYLDLKDKTVTIKCPVCQENLLFLRKILKKL